MNRLISITDCPHQKAIIMSAKCPPAIVNHLYGVIGHKLGAEIFNEHIKVKTFDLSIDIFQSHTANIYAYIIFSL